MITERLAIPYFRFITELLLPRRLLFTLPLIIRGLPLAVLFLSCNSLHAQFTYVNDQSIPVRRQNGELLNLPWAGGLNATQFNTMDINSDGTDDLVLFDRMANKVITFLSIDNKYYYKPEYQSLFPDELSNWMLLRDFNCDGKKDIFTGNKFGARVYTNVTPIGVNLKWEPFLFYSQSGVIKSPVLLTKGFSGRTNLQMQYDDLPAITDLDGDGDLDILSAKFSGDGTVELHRNFSMERYGTCDSLDFERVTQSWGSFKQCLCEDFSYNNQECPAEGGGRVQHVSGKALLAIDLNNDSTHDLIYSESECNNLYALNNNGTIDDPIIDSAIPFPAIFPVTINTFPAAFYEDVDFDEIKDLISSPNIFRREFLEQDLKSSTWYYKNMGSNVSPVFVYKQNDFLQGEMIDVGDNAVPAFCDEDGDGDQDMFIGYFSSSLSNASLYFFENVGSAAGPHFKFVSEDYSRFASLGLYNIKPQFIDLNQDSRIDLFFLATDLKSNITAFYYLLNKSAKGISFNIEEITKIDLQLDLGENFHLTDTNSDGLPDLLIGRADGSLQDWHNIGIRNSPNFSLVDSNFLGLGSSILRRNLSCFAADFDNDGNVDMLLSDQTGIFSIIRNYRNATDISGAIDQLLFNPLLNSYNATALGKVWPTAVNLFNSKRPAIVAGTILGGLQVFRNEGTNLEFRDLIINVYPNPLKTDRLISVEINLPGVLHIVSMQGREIISPVLLEPKVNTIQLPDLAQGMYIFKFVIDNESIFRKIIVR